MDKYDNSFILFKNDDKKTENHPDYKGTIIIDGQEYWLSSWINEGKNGKYMTGKWPNKKESKAPEIKQKVDAADNDFDNDIPF